MNLNQSSIILGLTFQITRNQYQYSEHQQTHWTNWYLKKEKEKIK